MSRAIRIILGLALVTALVQPLHAQLTDNDAIDANALVVAALTVSGISDLDFGAVLQGTPATVDAQNANSGEFSVTGSDAAGIDVDVDLPTVLNGPAAATMPIDTYTLITGDNVTRATAINRTTAAGGLFSYSDAFGPNTYGVFVGGQVSPAAAQAVGLYTNTITLTVTYNGS